MHYFPVLCHLDINTLLALELLVVPNDIVKPEDAIECVYEDNVEDIET